MKNLVMLDLETLGTGTNAAIIAIGAVSFDGVSKITGHFYEVIDLASAVDAGLKIEADTVMWWMKQSDAARKQFERKGLTLREVLEKFSFWIGENAEVWGNGSDFDNAILSDAYRACGMDQPWKFRNNRCYRTVKNMHLEIKMERVGTHHNAVDDAASQAKHLMRILSC